MICESWWWFITGSFNNTFSTATVVKHQMTG